MFNGKNLEGWTPKIRGHELGKNYLNTFRVVDGLLTVGYDKYTEADFLSSDGSKKPSWDKFGHLFYKTPYSHYMLRCEYRFVGDQIKNGPNWAIRNNGLMLHGQDPKTMTVDQLFPVSIEAQLLGGNGKDKRPTLNLCTPGTHVVKDGKMFKTHCTKSKSKTFHGDDWVTVEVEVRGNEIIRHWIGDEVVLEYTQPQLDPKDKDAQPLIKKNKGELMLSGGTISIQSESHGTQFRKIELFELDPKSKYDPNKKPMMSKMAGKGESTDAAKVAGNWGHLKGKIVVSGSAPEPAKEDFGGNADAKTCKAEAIDDNLLIGDDGGLKDVVVLMYRGRRDALPAIHPSYAEAMKKPVVVDNKNCRFTPHVVLARVGQQLECKNSDPVGHNCHGTTFNNEFNPLIPANGSVTVDLKTPDTLPGAIKCDVHPWMDAVLMISDHPYMAATAEDGSFEIKNIPVSYTHLTLPTTPYV